LLNVLAAASNQQQQQQRRTLSDCEPSAPTLRAGSCIFESCDVNKIKNALVARKKSERVWVIFLHSARWAAAILFLRFQMLCVRLKVIASQLSVSPPANQNII